MKTGVELLDERSEAHRRTGVAARDAVDREPGQLVDGVDERMQIVLRAELHLCRRYRVKPEDGCRLWLRHEMAGAQQHDQRDTRREVLERIRKVVTPLPSPIRHRKEERSV